MKPKEIQGARFSRLYTVVTAAYRATLSARRSHKTFMTRPAFFFIALFEASIIRNVDALTEDHLPGDNIIATARHPQYPHACPTQTL